MAHNKMSTGYLVGVDFGQLRDHTAVAICEQVDEFELNDGGNAFGQMKRANEIQYLDCVMLRRLDLGLPYHRVTEIICNIMRELPPLKRKPVILCDATGVGRAPIDFIRKAGLQPISITFTAGMAPNEISCTELHIPKKDLVSSTVLQLQNGTLRIAADLEHGPLLMEELRGFSLKIRESGHQAFEAGRENIHDDIVFALMMCAFFHGRNRPKPAYFTTYHRPEGGVVALRSI